MSGARGHGKARRAVRAGPHCLDRLVQHHTCATPRQGHVGCRLDVRSIAAVGRRPVQDVWGCRATFRDASTERRRASGDRPVARRVGARADSPFVLTRAIHQASRIAANPRCAGWLPLRVRDLTEPQLCVQNDCRSCTAHPGWRTGAPPAQQGGGHAGGAPPRIDREPLCRGGSSGRTRPRPGSRAGLPVQVTGLLTTGHGAPIYLSRPQQI
jgi:hypothetical protein